MTEHYLVVGASGGIGRELVTQLAGAGKQVTATFYKNAPDIIDAQIQFHYLNVLEEDPVLDFLPDELTGFVYCPGSINLRPFERISAADFELDYRLQVLGAIKILQVILPRLKKSANAAVVLFSTVAVQRGLLYHSQVASSKSALEGLTRALAAEYAPAIRINCIAPSLVDTPLAASLLNTEQKKEANALRHPLKRIGSPADIANMAAFLLSEKASWITGQVLHVDGGMSSIKN